MADLRIDYGVLHGAQATLATIAEEFEDMHKRRGEETRIWGGSHMRHQMSEFASNWDRHREDLTRTVRKLAGDCGTIAEEFQAIDQALCSTGGPEP